MEYLLKNYYYFVIIIILIYNDDNLERAKQIQKTVQDNGIEIILTNHESIMDTMKKMEEWSYATVKRT